MTSYRFPKIAGSVRWQGAVVRLNHGQVWPADDPLVQARPDLFSDAPHELTTSPRQHDAEPTPETTGKRSAPRATARGKAKQQ